MAEEITNRQISELLKQKLAEQDELRKRFNVAGRADSLKEDMDLGESYRTVTELRMDRESIYAKHLPTELLNQWSAVTGPRRLKNSIESWVDETNSIFPGIGERSEAN